MKRIIQYLITLLIVASCTNTSNTNDKEIIKGTVMEKRNGTIIQIVKLKTELSEEELLKIAREREPEFKAISGIVQKYYIKIREGEYGGVYVWDSAESLKEFKNSQIAASIVHAYRTIEPPSVEIVDILFQLRE
jgi:heme-degrading monooxygenase HmoA